MSKKERYLFLFTITPVQSFLAQARKTQDLYAGSFLLSHLCKTVLKNLPGDTEVIFPESSNISLPNRFLAIVECSPVHLREIGQRLVDLVNGELKRISELILERLGLPGPAGFDEQIMSYFTMNWATHHADDYEQRYREIESLMGAIKPVRVFRQFSDREKGRKCSVCGERNVKFYRRGQKEHQDEKTLKERKLFSEDVVVIKEDRGIPLRYLQLGEGLCGPCFIKRCLDRAGIEDYEASFPSTAEIALFDALTQLKQKYPALNPIIESGKFDPSGVFALKNRRSLEEFVDLTHEEKENTEEVYKALNESKIEFSSYYAAMLFDGDSMGRWLSGELIECGRLKEFHRKLTRRVSEFTVFVRDNVRPPVGVTVYAGGEDFLGFFNLSYLLDTVIKLRDEFDRLVNQPLKEFYVDKDRNMTFSAGIVIAHFRTPLSEVLNWARRLEKEAKDIDQEKDAFALAVLKHTGEIEKTLFRWRTEDGPILNTLGQIIDEIRHDRLSDSFIRSINKEMMKLMDEDGNFTEDQIIDAELKRLLMRSFKRQKAEDREDFERRKRETIKRFKLKRVYLESKSLQNFLGFLNIAGFISHRLKGGRPGEDTVVSL